MKPGRFEKTLERNLNDLEEHLFFLRDEFAKTVGGDNAYSKKISSTLRTLICMSDRTEGLLWRVAESIGADDTIEIQAFEGIDENNSIAQSLSFALVPFCRPGEGALPIDAQRLSLKKFIKTFSALYYEKKSYTHEALIKYIAQQMGSAHEAEGVDPFLIELSAISYSHKPALVNFLLTHAEFTLEVGEKVLKFAAAKAMFRRQVRPPIAIPSAVTKAFLFLEGDNFVGREEIKSDQDVCFVARAPSGDWEDDGFGYNFGNMTARRVLCALEKYGDGTIEMKIYSSMCIYIRRVAITSCGKRDIVAFARFQDAKWTAILNGKVD